MSFLVNVPNVPGIPAVNFAVGAIASAVQQLTGDLIGDIAPVTAIWGIYQGGSPVVVADSVVGFSYKQEWSISDFPVEKGSFESYDKVQLPFDVRVQFTAGGSNATRAALLNSLAAIAGTTQIFDVVTPEVVYQSVTITHYDYSRTARNGVGLLKVDVWLLQVNQNTTTAFSASTPDGQDPAPGGSPQPQQAGTPLQNVVDTAGVTTIGGLNVAQVAAAGGVP